MSANINVERLTRRTAYLDVMGIDSWVPRRPLEGAGAHIYLVQQAQSNNLPAPEKPAGKVGLASAARQKLITEVMQGSAHSEASGDGESPATQEDSSTIVETSPSVSALPARFELSISVVGDFIILDDISNVKSAPSVYQNWLVALSMVLNSSGPPTNSFERLCWPEVMGGVDTMSTKPASDALVSARELVQTWTLRQIRHKPRCLILMGEIPCLLFNEQAFQEWVTQNAQLAGLQLLHTPSSLQVWESAANKRRFWLQLDSLSRS